MTSMNEVSGLVIVALASVGSINSETPGLDVGIAWVGVLMDWHRGAGRDDVAQHRNCRQSRWKGDRLA